MICRTASMPLSMRHGNVGNDNIGPEFFRSRYKFTAVFNHTGDVKVRAEQSLQPFNENFVVVSYQQPRLGHVLPLTE